MSRIDPYSHSSFLDESQSMSQKQHVHNDAANFDSGEYSQSQSQHYHQEHDSLWQSQSQSQQAVFSQRSYETPAVAFDQQLGDEEKQDQGELQEMAPVPLNQGDEQEDSDEEDDNGMESDLLSPAEVIRRMEGLAESIVLALADYLLPELYTYSTATGRRGNNASLLLPSSKKKRFVFHNLQQSRAFSNVLLVLSFCHALLLAQRTTTTREVYYFYVTHFRSQNECNAAITEAAKLLRVPRSSLGLFASPKGWFCGCIQIVRDGRVVMDGQALSSIQGAPITQEWLTPAQQRDFTIDCQVHPRGDEDENDAPRRAKCILVIEKEGVYNRFSEDRLYERYPCILVTGKGFPDLATRSLVYSLHKQLDVPVYGLVDCNPYGLLVLHTYQYGSERMGLDGGTRYSVPIHWLGLRPSHVEEIGENTAIGKLPSAVYQKLTDLDKKRLEQLLSENHRFHDCGADEETLEELELMEANGYKVELESLNWLGMDFMVNWVHGVLMRYEDENSEQEQAHQHSEFNEEEEGEMEDNRHYHGYSNQEVQPMSMEEEEEFLGYS